jgi:hypothetical protein
MTALLPPGIQPRQNFMHTGVAVNRMDAQQSLPDAGQTQFGTLAGAHSDRSNATSHSKGVFHAQNPAESTGGQSDGGHGAADTGERSSKQDEQVAERRNLTKLLAKLSKNPDSTEFVYLRPYLPDAEAPVSERLTPINPYHIEVVPHSMVDPNNYFTMSSFGVTHLVDGSPSFMELGRWQQVLPLS